MSDLETVKADVLQEIKGVLDSLVPQEKDAPFWADVAQDFAAQKAKYAQATTPDEKAAVEKELVFIHRSIEMRLARKELRLYDSAAKIAKRVTIAAVSHLFPGVGFVGQLAGILMEGGTNRLGMA